MKLLRILGVLMALLAGAPAIAHAQAAYTAKNVHLRAGPARDYPVVAILPAGLQIAVEGCLSGYSWCDVVAGPYRGWVYAGNIDYPYQGADVPVLTYGAMIGFGIVAFSVGDYWDHYYRGRPWYSQRQEWMNRPRAAFREGGHRPVSQAPVARPGGQRPPQQAPVARPSGQRPPQQAPAARPGNQRPPEQTPVVRQSNQRPAPQGQVPRSSQHAPQGQAPVRAQQPRGQEPSGSRHPEQGHEPGGR